MPYANPEGSKVRSKRIWSEKKVDPKKLEAHRAEARDWYKKRMKDPAFAQKMRERSAARRRNNLEKVRETQRTAKRKQLYGITREEYQKIHAAQGGVCAICGKDNGRHALAVDHCHTTGAVRGLLCHRCNQALGQFRDSPSLLIKAVDYLRGYHLR